MGAEKYLFYEAVPKWFMFHKKNTILEIELSGIQSFIFGSIGTDSTVSGVSRRSEYIQWLTGTIEENLCTRFGGKNFYPVQSSSGKIICAVRRKISMDEIDNAVKEIQLKVYKATEGQLEMFYGLCEAVVRKFDERLYTDGNVLSQLGRAVSFQKYHCVNTLFIDEKDVDGSEFAPERMPGSEESEIRPKNKRTAALKFDLDNLGLFFRGIHTVDRSKQVSGALDTVLKSSFANEKNASIIFVGGDDIFAIADIEDYLGVITRVRSRILNAISENPYLSLYKDFVGISGSVTEIRNDLGAVPLIYYYNEGEEMLEKAKTVPGKNSVAMRSGGRVITLQWEQIAVLHDVYMRCFSKLSPEERNSIPVNIIRMRDLFGRYCTEEEWNAVKSIG